MTKWPSEDELRKVDKLLAKAKGSWVLPPNASPKERFKHDLCQKLVIYMNREGITQRELARILGTDEARVSEVTHYRVKRVSVDKLMDYVERINKKVVYRVA